MTDWNSIYLPLLNTRDIISTIQKALNPDAVLFRRRLKLERRFYVTGGPNHVWASDGHDKLLPCGILIYGFVDCWSRKILGLYAHVTNSDPRHVALWYLGLVKKYGGIPKKLTTDRGTETIALAGHQLHLGRTYGDNPAQHNQYHRYVPSTANVKIECLWGHMTDGLTGNLKADIEFHKANDYDEHDQLQR